MKQMSFPNSWCDNTITLWGDNCLKLIMANLLYLFSCNSTQTFNSIAGTLDIELIRDTHYAFPICYSGLKDSSVRQGWEEAKIAAKQAESLIYMQKGWCFSHPAAAIILPFLNTTASCNTILKFIFSVNIASKLTILWIILTYSLSIITLLEYTSKNAGRDPHPKKRMHIKEWKEWKPSKTTIMFYTCHISIKLW